MMGRWLAWFLLACLLNSCNTQPVKPVSTTSADTLNIFRKTDALRDSIVEGRNGPMSQYFFVKEIEEDNKRYKISDSAAKAFVLKIKRLNYVAHYKYGGTHSSLFVAETPSGFHDCWGLEIMQITEGSDHGSIQVFVEVYAKTGEISSITDYTLESHDGFPSMSLKEWEKANRTFKHVF
jgi:hypothetical protein